jgi:arylsulfatase
MNLMEAHAPYDYIPETFQTDVNYRPPRKLSPDMDFGTQSDRNRLCTAYDDAAQYLAKQYATLFDLLTTQFDYVITLADHGEMLGENECWGHESGLYPELVHVPLVVWGDDTADGTVKTPVSTLSVYQTILDIAELDLNVDRHGQSLLGEITSEAHLTEEHGLKQQRIAADTYSRALFEHLTTEELADVNISIDRGVIREDGEYIHPQEGKSPAVTGKAATIRDAIVADLDIAKYVKKKDSEMDEGVKDRLSRLGYR